MGSVMRRNARRCEPLIAPYGLRCFQDHAADDFEKHAVPACAEIIGRRLYVPGVFEVCVGMATIQQLTQECQYDTAFMGAPVLERRQRQAFQRSGFMRNAGIDAPYKLFELVW